MAQSLLLPAMRTIVAHFFPQKTLLPLLSPKLSSFTIAAKTLSSLAPVNTHKLKTPAKPHAILNQSPNSKPTLLLNNKDQRFLGPDSTVSNENSATTRSTIAAIVTSVGGPPAAVGIVRLSGPSAVDIASRVFRPKRKKKKNSKRNGGLSAWQPSSHVVDYGVVFDHEGHIIDEVLSPYYLYA